MQPFSILFICTGNAGRSQMAEALLRTRVEETVQVCSAGVEPWQDLHPMAVKVMAEQGISLEGHFPKSVLSWQDRSFDITVTIGERAKQETPQAFLGNRWIHWDIADPADADGTPESLDVFRRTRDRIDERLSEIVRLSS